MLELILVIHPETTANKNKLFQGMKDYPYSERGLQQLDRAVDEVFGYVSRSDFRRGTIDFIATSPLDRAANLARQLLKKEKKTNPSLGYRRMWNFAERRLGELEAYLLSQGSITVYRIGDNENQRIMLNHAEHLKLLAR